MNNSPLEFLAKKYGNIIKELDIEEKDPVTGKTVRKKNVAGIFVKFPKMKSSDLAATLNNKIGTQVITNIRLY